MAKSKLHDELQKLGLRVRARTVSPASEDKPGHIAFDELGNAIHEWNTEDLAHDGARGERARRTALAHPALTLMDEHAAPDAPIRNNAKGLRLGYDPYESGLLPNKDRKKKRDLRELSKWIEAKKRLEQDK